jgi:hypothetical protein
VHHAQEIVGVKLSRQSRYSSKLIASPEVAEAVEVAGAAGCAASPGSHSVTAIAVEAAKTTHFIGIPSLGCPAGWLIDGFQQG